MEIPRNTFLGPICSRTGGNRGRILPWGLFLLFFFAPQVGSEPGSPAWTTDLPAPPAGNPVVLADRVWVPLDGGELHSVRLVDGQGAEVRQVCPGPGESGPSGFSGGLLARRDRLWWGEAGGGIGSWDPAGSEDPLRIPVDGSPLFPPQDAGPHVVALTTSSAWFMEGETGRVIVRHPLEAPPAAPGSWHDGLLALPLGEDGGERQQVLVLEVGPEGAREVARRNLPAEAGPLLLRNGRIWVGAGDQLLAWRLRSRRSRPLQPIWRRRLGGPVSLAPILRGEELAVFALDNWLWLLRAEDGNLLRKVGMGRRILEAPVILEGGRILVLAPEGGRRLREVSLATQETVRSWELGREGQILQSGPATDGRDAWLVALWGPYRWQVAAFHRLEERRDGAESPDSGRSSPEQAAPPAPSDPSAEAEQAQ